MFLVCALCAFVCICVQLLAVVMIECVYVDEMVEYCVCVCVCVCVGTWVRYVMVVGTSIRKHLSVV